MYIGVLLLLNSCINKPAVQKERNSEEVQEHDFDLSGKYKSTDTLYFEKKIRSDTIDYIYWIDNHIDSMWCRHYLKKVVGIDTILFYDGLACLQEEIKFYEYKDKSFPVKMYNCDDINSQDEECVVYFNDSLGILLVYSTGWLYMEGVFVFNDMSKHIVNSILKDTTNDFPLFDRNDYFRAVP